MAAHASRPDTALYGLVHQAHNWNPPSFPSVNTQTVHLDAVAQQMSPSPMFDRDSLLQVCQARWLKTHEVLDVLSYYSHYGFSLSSNYGGLPSSGSIFFFDKLRNRSWRRDGHDWRKRKDGKALREDHEKLKIDAVSLISCCYVHGEGSQNDGIVRTPTTFHRRAYWLLNDGPVIFVHFLDDHAALATRRCLTTLTPHSTPNPRMEHASTASMLTPDSLYSNPYPSSPDSIFGGLDPQGSLTYHVASVPETPISPFVHSSPMVCTSSSFLPGADSLQDTTSIFETDDLSIDSRWPHLLSDAESSALRESTSSPVTSSTSSFRDEMTVMEYRNRIRELETRIMQLENGHPLTEETGGSSLDSTVNQLATEASQEANEAERCILDYSPEWDFTSGGAKILICIPATLCATAEASPLTCLFGETSVSGHLIQPGVVRCHAPPHAAGKVTITVIAGDMVLPSLNLKPFEYLEKLSETDRLATAGLRTKPNARPRDADWLDMSDRDFKVRIIERLGEIEARMIKQTDHAEPLESTDLHSLSISELNQLSDQALERLLRRMLSVVSNANQLVNELDESGNALLHYVAAVGFTRVIPVLMEFGAIIDLRNGSGLTPLHLASGRGQESACAVLVSFGSDIHAQDLNSRSPLLWAMDNQHHRIVSLLCKYASNSFLNEIPVNPSTVDNVNIMGSTHTSSGLNVSGTAPTTANTVPSQIPSTVPSGTSNPTVLSTDAYPTDRFHRHSRIRAPLDSDISSQLQEKENRRPRADWEVVPHSAQQADEDEAAYHERVSTEFTDLFMSQLEHVDVGSITRLSAVALLIQKNVRGWLRRRKAAAETLQSATRAMLARRQFFDLRRKCTEAAKRIQKSVRAWLSVR
eukprot:GILK01010820.1.p1 GENE.GILK01010820.1~~GILK01010820.1.p1  ORF type:complete len:870 (+),score=131.11 GILK01010820.1:119-2728(+)